MPINTVTKSLGLLEDLAVGINKVTQMRNGSPVTGNRVYVPVAVDSTLALAAIDPSLYLYAALVQSAKPTFYAYDSTGTAIGVASTVAGGVWYPVNSTTKIAVANTLQGTWAASPDNNFTAYQIGDLVVISGSLNKGAASSVTQLAINGIPQVKSSIMAIGMAAGGYVPVECYVNTAGLLVVPSLVGITGSTIIFNGSYTI